MVVCVWVGGVWVSETPQSMRKNRKLEQKIASNSGKIWSGKVGQNLFWLLVYI